MPLDIKPLPRYEVGEEVLFENEMYTVMDVYKHDSVYVRIRNNLDGREIAVCRLDVRRRSS